MNMSYHQIRIQEKRCANLSTSKEIALQVVSHLYPSLRCRQQFNPVNNDNKWHLRPRTLYVYLGSDISLNQALHKQL